jgi:hypothetical protein
MFFLFICKHFAGATKSAFGGLYLNKNEVLLEGHYINFACVTSPIYANYFVAPAFEIFNSELF